MSDFIKKYIKKDLLFIVILVIAWQLSLTMIGFLSEKIVENTASHQYTTTTITSHTNRWDGGWYATISGQFYRNGEGHEVFYPLFPLAAKAIQKASFGQLEITQAGLLVNTISTCFAVIALYQIAIILFKDKKIAYFGVLLFLTYPAAFFMHAFYTEALFCAFGFWAYYFALKRTWGAMALCLAALTATRITSILFILLCGLEFFRAYGYKIKALFNRNLLWFLLCPLGFIIYGLYLYEVRGSFFRMFSAYDKVPDWGYQTFNPNFFLTYLKSGIASLKVILGHGEMTNGVFVNMLLPFISLTLLICCSLYAIIKIKSWGVPVGIFGLTSFMFFTINNNTTSSHRYVLTTITTYLIVMYLLKKYKALFYPILLVSGVMLMMQVFLFTLFVNGYFAG